MEGEGCGLLRGSAGVVGLLGTLGSLGLDVLFELLGLLGIFAAALFLEDLICINIYI